MNEVMFVTGGELLQFLPISSKKRVGMSICFFGHLKEEKYKWGQVVVFIDKKAPIQRKAGSGLPQIVRCEDGF